MRRCTVLIKFTFCKLGKKEYMYHVIGLLRIPVPDPDLEIRRDGGRGGWSPKKIIQPFSLVLK